MTSMTRLNAEVRTAADRVPFAAMSPTERHTALERAVREALRHVNDADVMSLASAIAPEAWRAHRQSHDATRLAALHLIERVQTMRLEHAVWRGPVYRGSDGAGGPHCADCARFGHVLTHPDKGCADVGCDQVHGGEPSDADIAVAAGALKFAVVSALDATDPTPTSMQAVVEVVEMVCEGWAPAIVERAGGIGNMARWEHRARRELRNARGEEIANALEEIAGHVRWWAEPMTITDDQQAVLVAHRDAIVGAARALRDARAALERAGVR